MCHDHRHHRTDRVARDVRAEDFRRRPDLRASDAEREAVVARLREHGAAGRLDVDELEERVGAAYAARTHGELARLFDDLPNVRPVEAMRARPRRPVRPGERRLSDELRVFAGVNLLLVAIWLFAGAGYFWPVWVMIWWGVALALKLPLRHRAAHHRFHTPPGAG